MNIAYAAQYEAQKFSESQTQRKRNHEVTRKLGALCITSDENDDFETFRVASIELRKLLIRNERCRRALAICARNTDANMKSEQLKKSRHSLNAPIILPIRTVFALFVS